MIDGEWRYTTSKHVAQAMKEKYRIDDSAAREWMRKGAQLMIQRPGDEAEQRFSELRAAFRQETERKNDKKPPEAK